MAELEPPGGFLGPTLLGTGSGPPPPVASGGLMLSDVSGRSTTLNAAGEEILYEATVNLGAPTGTLTVRINASVRRTGTGTGTFTLYLGALTPGNTAGGTARVSFTTVSASDEAATTTSPAFVNPGGVCQLQITGICTVNATSAAHIRGVTVEKV